MNFNEKTMQKASVVVSLAILANLLWGSAAPTIKTGYRIFEIFSEDIPSIILFAGTRFFIAGVLTVIIGSIINGKLLIPGKSALPKICVLASFQTILQYIFFYIGCANATGSKATILSSTSSFISILISSLIFRHEKLTLRKIFGCMVGFAGVVLVNIKTGAGIDLDMSLVGEGFIVISTCAFAMSTAATKQYSKTENPVMLCGYQFILGGAVMVIAAIMLGGKLIYPGPAGIALLLYLAMVSAVAFSINSTLIKYNPVSRISVFAFFNPIFGVTLSMIILNESTQEFGIKGIIALLLVCLGVFIVNYTKKEKAI